MCLLLPGKTECKCQAQDNWRNKEGQEWLFIVVSSILPNQQGEGRISEKRIGFIRLSTTLLPLTHIRFCMSIGKPVMLPEWIPQVQVWYWILAYCDIPLPIPMVS
jgi:hypothetical protein